MGPDMEKIYDLCLAPSAAALDIAGILDGERLLRLHPHWYVDAVEPRQEGLAASLRDHATGLAFSPVVRLEAAPETGDGDTRRPVMRLLVSGYRADELFFFAEGDRSRVLVRYPADMVSEEDEQDVQLWIRAIQEYLRLYTVTTPRTLFFRLLMNRVILPMNPSQRKICLMIARITVIELVVILILVLGYTWYLH